MRKMRILGEKIAELRRLQGTFVSVDAIKELEDRIANNIRTKEHLAEEAAAIEPEKEWHIVAHDQQYLLDQVTDHDYWIDETSVENDQMDETFVSWTEKNGVSVRYSNFVNTASDRYPGFRDVSMDIEVVGIQRDYPHWGKEWK